MLKYGGMRIRPSFDQIVNVIQNDPYKIKYPNRDASFMINSPYFLNLMGEGSIGLEEQNQGLIKAQLAEARLRAEGRGGLVDGAIGGGDTSFDEGAARARDAEYGRQEIQRQQAGSVIVRAARRGLDVMRRQRDARQANQRRIQEEQEAQDRRRSEAAEQARALIAGSVRQAIGHPVASAAAASSSAAAAPLTIPISSPRKGAVSAPASPVGGGSPLDASMVPKVQTKRQASKENRLYRRSSRK